MYQKTTYMYQKATCGYQKPYFASIVVLSSLAYQGPFSDRVFPDSQFNSFASSDLFRD